MWQFFWTSSIKGKKEATKLGWRGNWGKPVCPVNWLPCGPQDQGRGSRQASLCLPRRKVYIADPILVAVEVNYLVPGEAPRADEHCAGLYRYVPVQKQRDGVTGTPGHLSGLSWAKGLLLKASNTWVLCQYSKLGKILQKQHPSPSTSPDFESGRKLSVSQIFLY